MSNLQYLLSAKKEFENDISTRQELLDKWEGFFNANCATPLTQHLFYL